MDAAWDYHNDYGKVTIIETPKHLIVEFYNGGWSENEEIEMILEQTVLADVRDHPMHVYTFDKRLIDPSTYAGIGRKKQKKYTYKVVRD